MMQQTLSAFYYGLRAGIRSTYYTGFVVRAAVAIITINAVAGGFASLCLADDAAELVELTDAQKAAAAVVTQQSVQSAVLFLASDEMQGRNTPSPELTIAEAFVAAQFQAIGLSGLGTKDGSFFDVDQITLSAPPKSPAVVKIGEEQIPVLGVLAGGSEDMDITATVVKQSAVDPSADGSPSIMLLPNVTVPPQSTAFLPIILASRLKNTPKNTVVLVKCPTDSPLIEAAQKMRSSPQIYREGRQPKVPVVLVPDTKEYLGQQVMVQVDAQRIIEEPVRNVVAVLRGSDEELSKEAIIVSAHLDHIGTTPIGPDSVFNGADDNATGVTGVLNLARAFAALPEPPKRTLIFMTFWGEEKGLMGSKRFAQNPTWPLDKIVANVNIEMLGRPDAGAREKVWMTGWKHSNLGELMNAGSSRLGVEIFNRTDVGEMLYTRSDNYSFVQQGLVAHSFSGGSLHDDYHQPTDESDRLDFAHMTKVIQGLFAGVLHIADSDVQIEKRK